MPNNPTYYALLEACAQPGCPVCRLVQDSVKRYLENLFYENVNDSTIRHHLRNSLGFCNEHAWLLLNSRIGDALGMAIIYHDVLGRLLKRFPKQPPQASLNDQPWRRLSTDLRKLIEAIIKLLSPGQRCPACEQQEASTRMIVEVLGESLTDPAFIGALKASDGLCVPHLKQALKQIEDPAALTVLFAESYTKLEHMHGELAEFIRKSDYRFREEELGPEGDSWKRVVYLITGNDRRL